MALTDR
jgi:hypothetical protein